MISIGRLKHWNRNNCTVTCITFVFFRYRIWPFKCWTQMDTGSTHFLGEPKRAPHWSNGVPCDLWSMYDLLYRHMSFRKCPLRSNSLDNFNFAMHHQFCKCHHVQIIETASILHVQWAYSTTTSNVQVVPHNSWYSLHWLQLGHSPLSRPTTCTATMWAERCVSKTSLVQ